jgi:hypothetical protein
MTFQRRAHSWFAPGLRAGLALVVCSACPSEEAKDPSKAGLDKRDTELTHENCDVKDSDAVVHDANKDGRPELVQVMDGKHEDCRAVDLNMDGIIDVFVYFDDQGRQRRRESGFDRDNRPDEISHFQSGVITRKERETNNDGNIDTWDYYQGGRLVREERDSNGDGYVDQWWTFNQPGRPDCAVVTSDNDGDGKADVDSKIDLCKDVLPPPKPEQKPEQKAEQKAEPKPAEKSASPPDTTEAKAPETKTPDSKTPAPAPKAPAPTPRATPPAPTPPPATPPAKPPTKP